MVTVCLYLSIVLSQNCTTAYCTGCLHYDGRNQCLLNMKRLIFTYEVLRHFMFQFLIGGYVKRICVDLQLWIIINIITLG